MKRPVLLVAAFLAISAAASAQAPQDQRMAFGGGSSFEFVVPVNALGHIWVTATWSPNVPMRAYLFAPGRPHPVAEAAGDGSLMVAREVTSWRADKSWVLRLVATNPAANVRGNLRLVWPAGNRPGVAMLWRNAGPTDVAVLTQAASRIRAVQARLATSGMIASRTDDGTLRAWDRAAYQEILDVLQTRLEVLAATPARFVRNDAAVIGNGHLVPARSLDGARTVTAGYTELRCTAGSPYHVDHESDAPYVVTAIVPEGDAGVAVGRSPVIPMLRPGDVVPATTGGQDLARTSSTPARIAVAVLERETGSADQAMAQFLRAVELFRLYRAQAASTPADADFPWFVSLAVEASGEAILGAPELLTITGDGIYDAQGRLSAWQTDRNGGRRATPALSLGGSGGQVQVTLSVAADRR